MSHIYKDEINFPGIKPFSIDDYNFILSTPNNPFAEFPALAEFQQYVEAIVKGTLDALPTLIKEASELGLDAALLLAGYTFEEVQLASQFNKQTLDELKSSAGYFLMLFLVQTKKINLLLSDISMSQRQKI